MKNRYGIKYFIFKEKTSGKYFKVNRYDSEKLGQMPKIHGYIYN